MGEDGGIKIVCENRKARFEYHIIDRFELGIVLTGAEIKSVRAGGMSIAESYATPLRGELFLLGAHIKPYSHSADSTYNPTRTRKLLMKRTEIDRLSGQVEQKGYTLVPLKAYLKQGRLKVEVALAKGKAAPDKRESVRDRDVKREMARALRGKPRDRGAR